ncbi:MAG: hypothetical protein E2P02_04710 [Acidobacteria bacterium]|nr:MAG: hypothetical protein E2P02_04710 [Acidobacteriota bacterium]
MDQPTPGASPLDFEKAQFEEETPSELTCEYCKKAIDGVYFDVNGRTSCESCRQELESARTTGDPLSRFFRALAFGGIGGAIGAAIYYAVLVVTDYEIGLIALLVGFLVGAGVRLGSGGSGGRGYQVLAVAMTYMAIVSTSIPFIIEAMMTEPQARETQTLGDSGVLAAEPEVAAEGAALEDASIGVYLLALVVIGVIAMATPFLAGVENVIGILILGFALYEAWRMNAYQPLVVEGPFELVGDEPPGDALS